jgi:hypothetical protein
MTIPKEAPDKTKMQTKAETQKRGNLSLALLWKSMPTCLKIYEVLPIYCFLLISGIKYSQ